MHSKVFSATTIGVNAQSVEVEVDLSLGMIIFYIVGLPDTAIKESSKRIQTALKNSGVRLPMRRITVNLAPADLKKEGTLFDLPIAVGLLQAAELINVSKEYLKETLFLGELSLDGTIRAIKGALAIAYDAKKLGARRIVLPKANAREAALIQGLEVIGVNSIVELSAYLRGEDHIQPTEASPISNLTSVETELLDFCQVKGQQQAKRALQIAAAGRHNTLFIGAPGSGKTMLAKRLPSIMPPMTLDEIIHTSKIYSVTGKLNERGLVGIRPFRSPHHSISQAGLVGGGSFPQPGEISLAHNGILFLDELTEFRRTSLEALRQPLENRTVSIARAQQTVSFPSSFLLIAALNPCPCGFWGDKRRSCTCSLQHVQRYMEKLSGPLLDRIDVQVNIQSIDYTTMKEQSVNESSQELYAKVLKALKRQEERFGSVTQFNGHMSASQVDKHCVLTPQAETILKRAFDALHLSMRGYHKILKVARTIADLDDSDVIDVRHIQEAVLYRSVKKEER